MNIDELLKVSDEKELEKITNLTINELLNNEIILPSLYLENLVITQKRLK